MEAAAEELGASSGVGADLSTFYLVFTFTTFILEAAAVAVGFFGSSISTAVLLTYHKPQGHGRFF